MERNQHSIGLNPYRGMGTSTHDRARTRVQSLATCCSATSCDYRIDRNRSEQRPSIVESEHGQNCQGYIGKYRPWLAPAVASTRGRGVRKNLREVCSDDACCRAARTGGSLHSIVGRSVHFDSGADTRKRARIRRSYRQKRRRGSRDRAFAQARDCVAELRTET